MKKALLGWLAVLLVLSMTSCSFFMPAQDKTFSVSDMTITLDDSFTAYKPQGSDQSFVSDKHGYAVSVDKVAFSLFDDEEDPLPATLEAFATSQNPDVTIDLQTYEQVTYYTYEKIVNDRNFTYLVALYTSVDAYWEVAFTCESQGFDKAKPVFLGYAQTVLFETTETLPLT